MWGIIAIIATVLFFIYWLMRKPKEKDDGYGSVQSSVKSSGGLFDKVKDACCTRGR